MYVLFSTSVKWCGWDIEKHGIEMNPRHLEGLINESQPETGEELSQLVHCAQCMSQRIPSFSTRVTHTMLS